MFQEEEPFHALSPDVESATRIFPVRGNLSVFSLTKGGNLQEKAPFRGFLGDSASKTIVQVVLFSLTKPNEVRVRVWKNALSDADARPRGLE